MKIKYLLSSIIILALLLVGCNDLDTLPMGDEVTSTQKEGVYENNPERSEAGVNAIFAQFNQYMPNETALNASRHNDFGYPSIMLFTDANGMDLITEDNGYNWTGNSLDFADRSHSSNEAQIVWNDLYSIIYTANTVISTIDPETEEAQTQFFLAQGHAARAFTYFNLAQLYQFNYVGNESKPCVPIVTNENSSQVEEEGAPRSTVQQVYDLILDDLNTAIELFTSSKSIKRNDKRYMNLAVAYGLRARVHLTMQKWSEAAADASSAISESDAAPAGLTDVNVPSFMDSSEKNWMWGIIIAETDRVVTSGIVNWISHMGSLNYGYANFSGGRQINKTLYATIPETDVRKGWWLDEQKKSVNLSPEFQAAATGYGYAPFTQVKFAPYKNVPENSTNANDIPLMRIEEMYLIKAEAEAMGAGAAVGVETLNNFVKTYRDPAYAFSATSAEEVQEEVYRQRRIELWGEGLNWYDVMRLNKGVDRRGAGFPDKTMIFNIPSGDPILLWRIPEKEIIANPALSEGDNNPSAPAPTPVADI